MENRAIARMLSETADLMEISAEDSFRIRSYRTAAGVIEGHPEQVSVILKDPAKKLTDIAGIGKGIASVIADIERAGSLRRSKETVGDLDLLVTGPGAAEALEKFVVHPRAQELLGKGPNKASIKFGLEGLQVDLRALATESYGAALLYFTGSKEHNI